MFKNVRCPVRSEQPAIKNGSLTCWGEPGRKNKVSVNLSFSSGYTEPWRAVGADMLRVDGNPSPIVELRLLTQGFAFINLETCKAQEFVKQTLKPKPHDDQLISGL